MKKEKHHIHHYKDGDKWTPFSLEKKHSKKLTEFCVRLSLLRPKSPDMNYDDYIEFMESLNDQTHKKTLSNR